MQLFTTNFTITQYLSKQSLADSFIFVNWNYRTSSILVSKEMMAPFNSNYFKAKFIKSFNEVFARHGWKGAHTDTDTCCTPINSFVTSSSSTSKHTSIASLILSIN